MEEVLTLLGMLLVIAAILALAYFSTRFLGRLRMGTGVVKRTTGNTNLKLLDQMVLGNDQRLMVVQTGGRYLVLGVSSAAIQTLAELTAEEASCWTAERMETTDPSTSPPSFQDAFLQVLNRKKK